MKNYNYRKLFRNLFICGVSWCIAALIITVIGREINCGTITGVLLAGMYNMGLEE